VKKKAKNFVSGLIVPGDLSDDKMRKKLASGLIVPGDLPDSEEESKEFCEWSNCSRRLA